MTYQNCVQLNVSGYDTVKDEQKVVLMKVLEEQNYVLQHKILKAPTLSFHSSFSLGQNVPRRVINSNSYNASQRAICVICIQF